MAEKRKLIAEMDKVFRKVDEGVELFEEIMDKMAEANSDNQRDKFQDDLKKEIKKLQRLRDQIKGWQNSNDIKDKDKLIQYRRIIEQRMEQFKDIERENKTKPHSKQGLCAEEKLDPKVKEKSEAIEWLQNTIARLTEQTDFFDAEMENISPSGGGRKAKKLDKDKQKKIDSLKHRLEKHKFHIQKLELVMRLVNNDTIDSIDINDELKEHLTVFMDELMEEEQSDIDFIYEELNLGDLAEITQQLGNVTNIGTLEEADNVSDGNSHPSGSPSHSPQPPKEGSKEPEEHPGQLGYGKTRYTSGSEYDSRTGGLTIGTASGARSVPVTPLKLTQQLSSDSGSTAPLSAVSPGAPFQAQATPTLSYNSVAAGRTMYTSTQPNTLTRQQSSTSGQGRLSPIVPAAVQHSASAGAGAAQSLSGRRSVDLTQQHPRAKTPVACVSLEHSLHSQQLQQQQTASVHSSASYETVTAHSNAQVDAGGSVSLPKQGQGQAQQAVGHVTVSSSSTSADGTTISSINNTPVQPKTHINTNTQPQTHTTGILMQQSDMGMDGLAPVQSLKSMAEQAIGTDRQSLAASFNLLGNHQPPTNMQPQQAIVPPELGASPLGKQAPSADQLKQLAALESAMGHMPLPCDSERQRNYLPHAPCLTPAHYPQTALPMADTFDYFLRLTPETLFFIFYYMEGTKAQYLAAKALKNKSWRFHKKFLMWFQRYEEPKTINDEFEMGTYIFFDFERWAQRKKEGFTFEYQFLEDRELT